MLIELAHSVNDVPIRLTAERWMHIVENHDELAGMLDEVLAVVEVPDYVLHGYHDALVALKRLRHDKYLAVVYKELSRTDGFIITAYVTQKLRLQKEKIVWQRT